MSKRKREIRSDSGLAGPAEPEGETDMPVTPQPRREKAFAPETSAAAEAAAPARARGAGLHISNALKENILLAVLLLYVVLLGLGTAGELFEADWILELPIFK